MASPAYWAYQFELIDEDRKEALTQALDQLPFNGFEETIDRLTAFVEARLVDDAFQARLTALLAPFDVAFQREWIAEQNWNAQWEAAFQPIRVDDFVGIRAEFHPPFEGVYFDLVIHPRMAFGTGHHATTFLMMRQMKDLPLAGARVFDYGCGTGILAILAKKLAAGFTDAVDIESAATENTFVNMEANDVDGITVYTGTLDAVPPTTYDIILANINRNVILASLGALYQRIEKGGDLLVSGILVQDRERVEEAAAKEGWQLQDIQTRDGWHMFHFKRP